MRSSIGFQQTLALGIALLLLAIACNSCGNSSSKPAVNMAGTWTVQAVSTQLGTLSGTATVAQSGAGLGNNGTTTLTAAVGTIAISESGPILTGTLTDSIKGINYSFSGTLSGGNIAIEGSAVSCVLSASITGTITSTSMQGNYTITRSSDCFSSNDAGTWTATKQ